MEVSIKGKATPEKINLRLNASNARRRAAADGAGCAATGKQFPNTIP
jgi:hypothetical protein